VNGDMEAKLKPLSLKTSKAFKSGNVELEYKRLLYEAMMASNQA